MSQYLANYQSFLDKGQQNLSNIDNLWSFAPKEFVPLVQSAITGIGSQSRLGQTVVDSLRKYEPENATHVQGGQSISFIAGASAEYEMSIDLGESAGFDTDTSVEVSIGTQSSLDWTLFSSNSGVAREVSVDYTQSSSSSTSSSRSTTFALADSTPGDKFWLQVFEDKQFGTPIFRVQASETRCPCESLQSQEAIDRWAVLGSPFCWRDQSCTGMELDISYGGELTCREQLQAQVKGPSRLTELQEGEDAVFTVTTTQTSVSEADVFAFAFGILPDLVEDPAARNGLQILINGMPVPGLASFYIPQAAREYEVRIRRLTGQPIYAFDDIKFRFESTCRGGYVKTMQFDSISKVVSLSAQWLRTAPSLYFLNSSLIFNSNTPSITIGLSGFQFDLDSPPVDTDRVIIQYRKEHTDTWYVLGTAGPNNLLGAEFQSPGEPAENRYLPYYLGADQRDPDARICPSPPVSADGLSSKCLGNGRYELGLLDVYSNYASSKDETMVRPASVDSPFAPKDSFPILEVETRPLAIFSRSPAPQGQATLTSEGVTVVYSFNKDLECTFTDLVFTVTVGGPSDASYDSRTEPRLQYLCHGHRLSVAIGVPLTSGNTIILSFSSPGQTVMDHFGNSVTLDPPLIFSVV